MAPLFIRYTSLFFLFFTCALWAAPKGFQLKAGEALPPVLDESGTLVVQSGHRTIVEWDSFSLQAGEALRFDQTSSNAAILNRVIGGQASEIFGRLESNGKVFLLNPHGILIGPGAEVQTGGFLASTLDLLDSDFLKERLLFSGEGEGSIVHLGTIECASGPVSLLSRVQVQSGGKIEGGQISCAVGQEILLQSEAMPSVLIRAPVEAVGETREGASIEHNGLLRAARIELKSDSNLFEQAIQCKGRIEATALEERGGEVFLVAQQGLCEVSGQIEAQSEGRGGRVHILGDFAGVIEEGRVDVSGKLGGGEILIGGDFRGQNPRVKNAKATFMGRWTQLKADALEEGDGGKVILWSDNATRAYGQISVRGGEKGGNGGFNEVSGKYIDFKAFSDRRAPKGKFGDLLLDPLNITISNAADSANIVNPGAAAPSGGTYTFTVGPCGITPANIDTTNGAAPFGLQENLAVGNITIDTSATNGAACTDTGTIAVSGTVTWATATTLNLIADSQITISSAISNTSTSTGFTAMNFLAKGNGTGSFDGISIGAALSTGNVTGGGNIILQGAGGPAGGRGVYVNSDITSPGGTVTFQNCIGGSAAINVYGVHIDTGRTVNTASIVGTGISGGMGTTTCYGFRVDGTCGGSNTSSISIRAEGSGTGANGQGIVVLSAGTIALGQTGSLTLVGRGSLFGDNTATGEHGIDILGTFSLSGAGTNTVTLTGQGGKGGGGGHRGVDFRPTSITLSGTTNFSFLNCRGGYDGNSNLGILTGGAGISIAAGSLTFTDCMGGPGGTGAYGIQIVGTITAPTIVAQGIMGGAGSGTNYGFYVTGTLGTASSPATTSIRVISGSLGAGNTENGMRMDSGTIQVADNGSIFLHGTASLVSTTGNVLKGIVTTAGTLSAPGNSTVTLVGIGGGVASASSDNAGIHLAGGSITVGTDAASTANLTFTGIGGRGTGGATPGNHHGFRMDTTATVTLNGTGALKFQNCVGGQGGNTNIAVSLARPITATNGSIQFENCTGGDNGSGGGSSNFGVRITTGSVITAASIIGRGLLGGPGATLSHGFRMDNGQLGDDAISTNTSLISIQGGSLGTTSGDGVSFAGGTIRAHAPSGSISLDGTGTLVGTATANAILGINIAGPSAFSATDQISLLGRGGTSTGSSCSGIVLVSSVTAGSSITLTGKGGEGAGGSNVGALVSGGTLSATGSGGTISFIDCTGGGAGANNHGVRVTTTVTAESIIGRDLMGGAGTINNRGFFMDTGQLGDDAVSTNTSLISIQAGSLGASTGEGILISGGAIRARATSGAISLDGTGTLVGTGGGIHGVSITGGTFATGASGSMTLVGRGGGVSATGSTGSNFGVNVSGGTISAVGSGGLTFTGKGGMGTATNRGVLVSVPITITGPITFKDCIGGVGTGGNCSGIEISGNLSSGGDFLFTGMGGEGAGGTNIGVTISSAITTSTSIWFRECSGGNLGDSNFGVRITGSGASILAPTIRATGIQGGAGVSFNRGFYVTGGARVGNSSTSSIYISAESLAAGNGQFNAGVQVDTANTVVEVGDDGVLIFDGTSSEFTTGGSNRGIDLRDTSQVIGGANSSLTFIGRGGGPVGSTGANCFGVTMTGGSIAAGSALSGTSTITIRGTGGNGTGGVHHGFTSSSTSSITLNGAGTLLFEKCSGGVGGSTNYGVNIQTSNINIATGAVEFRGVHGGTGTSDHHGVILVGSTTILSAPTITAVDVFSGTGTGGIGFYVNGGTLGDTAATTATTNISITAASLASGTNPHGIAVDSVGAIRARGTGGSIILNGTGGASTSVTTGRGVFVNSSTTQNALEATSSLLLVGKGGGTSALAAGANNYGVELTQPAAGQSAVLAGTGITLTGSGGQGTTGSHIGVRIATALTSTSGTIEFLNCEGGLGGTSNVGIQIAAGASVDAPTILVTNARGGNQNSNSNIGFDVTGGTVGSAINTTRLLIEAQGGYGTSAYGIWTTGGTLQTNASGSIALIGTGGGLSTAGVTNNVGIRIQGGSFSPGSGGLIFTGRGGTGTAGSHPGVHITSSFSITQPLTFLSCMGGSGSGNNYGVHVTSTVVSPTITALDIMGGSGVNNNYGFYLNGGTLGDPAATTSVNITAGSLGTGANEMGIRLEQAANIHVTNNGRIELNGSGSRLGTGISCMGVVILSTAGNGLKAAIAGGASDVGTIVINGMGGGVATAGGQFNYGISTASTPTISAGGASSTGSSITLTGVGGFGTGGTQIGVSSGASMTVNGTAGTLAFTNCRGGVSTGSGNYGIFVFEPAILSAPTITVDVLGGAGVNSNRGFYLDGGVSGASVGTTSTNSISITAGSLGSGVGEVGIFLNSAANIVVGNNGTIALNGTGGLSAVNGIGISLGSSSGNGLQAGVGLGETGTILLNGIGGGTSAGAGDTNRGVVVSSATTFAAGGLGGVGSSITITGVGGKGSGGIHDGVSVGGQVAVGGTNGILTFLNCTGGTGGTSNRGVLVTAGAVLTATSILGKDLVGGAGTTDCHGFFMSGGQMGDDAGTTNTVNISLQAGSLATTSGIGINTTGGTIRARGTSGALTFDGTGTLVGTGSSSHGIATSGTTFEAAGAITFLGNGGGLLTSSGSNFGILFGGGTFTAVGLEGVTFTGRGGQGSLLGEGVNEGVRISGALSIPLTSPLYFLNCRGGGLGRRNRGVAIMASTAAERIFASGVLGGDGIDLMSDGSNVGFFVTTGGILGGVGTTSVTLSAGSIGRAGTNNTGILIDSTGQILATGAGGSMTLIGNGSTGPLIGSNLLNCYGIAIDLTTPANTAIQATNGITLMGTGGGGGVVGSDNSGIFLSSGQVLPGSAELTLIGVGGTGGAGGHHGVTTGANTWDFGASNVTFLNCAGGRSSSGSNKGIHIAGSLTTTGSLTATAIAGGISTAGGNYGAHITAAISANSLSFSNITGGSSATGNYGLFLTSTLSAPTIYATDLYGGAGTADNHGFFNQGTFGSGSTTDLFLSAGSLGTLGGNAGIFNDTIGTIQVGNTASLSLFGAGSIAPTSTGTCYGIATQGAITAGTGSSIAMTGVGGGRAVGSQNYGIYLSGATSAGSDITLTGTGGQGLTGSNIGVVVEDVLDSTTGTIRFQDCSGGNVSTNNYGLHITTGAAVTASSIVGIDISGGAGTTNNHGLFMDGGQVGDAATTNTSNLFFSAESNGATSGMGIQITGGSLRARATSGTIALEGMGTSVGTGNNNHGIATSGTPAFETGASGAISLEGWGGGAISSTGSNAGISLSGGTFTLGSGGFTLTGTGGRGSSAGVGNNYGVNIASAIAVASNPIAFINCQGGAGGSSNIGVNVNGNLTNTAGTITFSNISGGSGGNSQYGIAVQSSRSISAPTITAADALGGSGATNNHGIYNAGTIGSSSTTLLTLSGESLGTTSDNAGIYNETTGTIQVGDAAILTLLGTGSTLSSSTSRCYGIANEGMIIAGAAGAASILTMNGTGGGRSAGDENYGIYVSGPVSARSHIAMTGVGGEGTSGSNMGIYIEEAITSTSGNISLTGTAGFDTATSHGVALAATLITATAGNIDVARDVLLVASTPTLSAGGDIAFRSTIDGAFALSLTAAGTITFEGNVGSSVALASLPMSAGVGFFLGGDITLTGPTAPIAFNAPVSLTNSSTLTSNGGPISFTSTVNGSHSLTAASGGGAITFSNAVGNTTPLIDLTVGGGATSLFGNITLNNGTATFSNAVILGNSIQVNTGATTGSALFASTIDGTTAGVQDLTLSSSGGIVSFGAAVGGTTRLGDLTLTSPSSTPSTLLLGVDVDAASVSSALPTLMTSSSTVNTSAAPAGTISWTAPIDGAAALVLNAGTSTIALASPVGGSTPLSGLNATASAISLGGNQFTTGAMAYNGPVSAAANTIFKNSGPGGLIFQSTLTGGGALTLLAPATTLTVQGAISTAGSGAGVAGGNFTARAGQEILFSDALSTQGGTALGNIGPAGGHVSLTSTGGNIAVAAINTSGTNGTTRGGDAGYIFLQPNPNLNVDPQLGNIPAGRIILSGDLTALGGSSGTTAGTNGTISLAPAGRTAFPSIATISSTFLGNDVTIQGGLLTIGENEAMTVLGDFVLVVDSSMTVRDIVVLNDFTVNVPIAVLPSRGPQSIIDSNGIPYISPDAHVLARSGLSITVGPNIGFVASAGTVPETEPDFYQLLTYDPLQYVLNFDTSPGPIPPGPSPTPISPILRAEILDDLLTALAEMEDYLPFLKSIPERPRLCRKEEEHLFCIPRWKRFKAFIPENGVRD